MAYSKIKTSVADGIGGPGLADGQQQRGAHQGGDRLFHGVSSHVLLTSGMTLSRASRASSAGEASEG